MALTLARNSSVAHKMTFSYDVLYNTIIQENSICKLSFVDSKMIVAEGYERSFVVKKQTN